MIYILIANGIVQNTIVAEQDFIDQIAKQYDTILAFKEEDTYPSPGDIYDGINFTPPDIVYPISLDEQINLIDNELQTLDPKFNLSVISQTQQIIGPVQGVDNAGI